MSIRDSILKKVADEDTRKQEQKRLLDISAEQKQREKLEALNTIRYDQLEVTFSTLTAWIEDRFKQCSIENSYYTHTGPFSGLTQVHQKYVYSYLRFDFLTENDTSNYAFNDLHYEWNVLCRNYGTVKTRCTFRYDKKIELRRGKNNVSSVDYEAYLPAPARPIENGLPVTNGLLYATESFNQNYCYDDAFGILHIREIEKKYLEQKIAEWLIENGFDECSWSFPKKAFSREHVHCLEIRKINPMTFKLGKNCLILLL